MGWVFDPDVLHGIAKAAIGKPIGEMVPRIVSDLREHYPKHVAKEPEWVLNNAGGAMGSMLVIHASLTEYVIIFGSPIGTEGHTGRFWADDFFMILEGEQWAYVPGDLEKRVYRPGDLHHMPRGVAQGYRFPENCWALEYARGVIPLMLPFGVADTLFSTLDFITLSKTFEIYTKLTTSQLLRGKL